MVQRKTLKLDLITKAAIKIFADKGYHPSRTIDISQEAGVAYGTLYQYFESKDDILLYIFRESWEGFVERIDRIAKDSISSADKLLAILDLIFRSYQNNPNLMKVLIMDVPRLSHFYSPEHQELYNRFFIHLAAIVEEGQKAGVFRQDVTPMIASFVIYGGIDTTIRQYIFNAEFCQGKAPMTEAKTQIMKILFEGVLE